VSQKKSFHERLDEVMCEDRAAWRAWLDANHDSEEGVWLVYWRVSTGKPSIRWEGAVQEALCYGWIDSTKKPIDEERYRQVFSPRKKKSAWSAVNKAYIIDLEADGLMTQAGRDKIEAAVADGSWTLIDDVEALVIPQELERALRAQSDALFEKFDALGKSKKKSALYRLFLAKRAPTRQKRIDEIIAELMVT
jgi:uncharacterized protein YdeI (YjbR/CyaY-like superfamily)